MTNRLVTKRCLRCGCEMTVDVNRKYCTECNNWKHRNEQKHPTGKKAKNEPEKIAPKPPTKSLNQMAREAHALKLSYGQYSTMISCGTLAKYCQMHGLVMPR